MFSSVPYLISKESQHKVQLSGHGVTSTPAFPREELPQEHLLLSCVTHEANENITHVRVIKTHTLASHADLLNICPFCMDKSKISLFVSNLCSFSITFPGTE